MISFVASRTPSTYPTGTPKANNLPTFNLPTLNLQPTLRERQREPWPKGHALRSKAGLRPSRSTCQLSTVTTE
ncbi:MAG: hypothetical protein F6J98_04225 [Moorea sp. SIO4G2]|nr:hypothetical protein [Moorena sp. SIO4G2]